MSSEADLAWTLAESMAERFDTDEKISVYVALGAGETFLAIRHMLEIAVHDAQPLPIAVVKMMTRWVETHAGSQYEAVLRHLLTNVRATTPPGVPAGGMLMEGSRDEPFASADHGGPRRANAGGRERCPW